MVNESKKLSVNREFSNPKESSLKAAWQGVLGHCLCWLLGTIILLLTSL